MATLTKKSGEVLRYTFNWAVETTDRSATISSSSITVPTGITIDLQTNDTTTATVTLSGGRHGVTYIINSEIVTSDGLTLSENFELVIDDYFIG